MNNRVLELLLNPKEEKTKLTRKLTKSVKENAPLTKYDNVAQQKPYLTLEGYKESIKEISLNHVPSLFLERVPEQMLGAGVQGRCYTGTTLAHIRNDIHGRDYEEVYAHKSKHAQSPWMSEYEVRFWTKAMFKETSYH